MKNKIIIKNIISIKGYHESTGYYKNDNPYEDIKLIIEEKKVAFDCDEYKHLICGETRICKDYMGNYIPKEKCQKKMFSYINKKSFHLLNSIKKKKNNEVQ